MKKLFIIFALTGCLNAQTVNGKQGHFFDQVTAGTGFNPLTTGKGLFYWGSAPANVVTLQSEMSSTVDDSDSGAIRGVYYIQGGNNAAGRAGEFQIIRTGGTGNLSTWGTEIGVHTSVAPSDPNAVEFVGASIYNAPSAGMLLADAKRANIGVYLWGTAGWEYAVKYLDTDFSVLWTVDKNAEMLFKGLGGLRYNGTNMQFSNNGGGTWTNMGTGGSSGFPILADSPTVSPTFKVGIITEADNRLIELITNDSRTGVQDDSLQGGFYRIDSAAGELLHQWFGRVATATTPTEIMSLSSDGRLGIGVAPGATMQLSVQGKSKFFDHLYEDTGNVYLIRNNNSDGQGVVFTVRDTLTGGPGPQYAVGEWSFTTFTNGSGGSVFKLRGGSVPLSPVEIAQWDINANQTVYGNVVPNTANAVKNGDTGKEWNEVHVKDLFITGTCTGTACGGAATFPITRTTGTYPVGIVTQVTDSLIRWGINDSSFGTIVTASQGGFQSVDGRAGEQLFQWWGRAATVGSPSQIMVLSSTGGLGIGSLPDTGKLLTVAGGSDLNGAVYINSNRSVTSLHVGDPQDGTTGHVGLYVMPYTSGDLYMDHKVYSNGYARYRVGSGTDPGTGHEWMKVFGTDGTVQFNVNTNISDGNIGFIRATNSTGQGIRFTVRDGITLGIGAAYALGEWQLTTFTNGGTGSVFKLRAGSITLSPVEIAQWDINGNQTVYGNLTINGTCTVGGSPCGGSGPFADNVALIKNSSDATKLGIFSAASITTATTRTYTMQDANYTVAGLNIAQTFSAAQKNTVRWEVTDGSAAHTGCLVTEVNGGLMEFVLNEGSNNRCSSNTYASSEQGGFFRFDSRAGELLFQLYGRTAGVNNSSGSPIFTIDNVGNGHVYGNLQIDGTCTGCGGGGSFPPIRTSGTYPIGMTGELSDTVVDFGINGTPFGTVTTGAPTGYIQIDARGSGNNLFHFYARPASGGGFPTEVAYVTDVGNIGSVGSITARAGFNSIGDASDAGIVASSYGGAGYFVGNSTSGTLSSPGGAGAGQLMALFGARGGYTTSGSYTGISALPNAGMYVYATSAHTNASRESHILFTTTPSGSASAVTRWTIASNGNLSGGGSVTATSGFFGNLTGNASTASALASTPSICSSGFAPRGIDTSGNATGCASISGGGGGITSVSGGSSSSAFGQNGIVVSTVSGAATVALSTGQDITLKGIAVTGNSQAFTSGIDVNGGNLIANGVLSRGGSLATGFTVWSGSSLSGAFAGLGSFSAAYTLNVHNSSGSPCTISIRGGIVTASTC